MQYERFKKNSESIYTTFINILMVFFLFLMLPNIALSLPEVKNIEGQVLNGLNIKIMGTLFGVNGPNLVIFDDFEGGTNGAPIKTGSGSAKYGQWGSTANTTSMYYTNSTSVSGNLSFQSDQTPTYLNWLQANLPNNTKDVFVSWWLYIPAGDNIPGEGNPDGRNWKQMWIQGDSPWDDDLVVPTLHSSWHINGNEPDPKYSNYTSVNFVKGEWKHLWIWLKGGYQSDGQCHFWELLNSGVVQRENDNNVNTLKNGGMFEKVRVNGYGRQASNSHPTFDDVYIASGPNARARVEIGNKSSYMNCTKLSIMTPVSWKDTEIQATVNQGSFKAGETAYLFVVDANGNVSNGHGPITIGSGGGGVPTPTDNPPTVGITSPTSASSYTSAENIITISGTAADDKLITGITWTNSSGGSGNAIDSAGDWSKFFADISLKEGENVITVTATDSNNKTSSDTLTVTYNSGNMAQSWSAIKQTADSNWKDSGVTYCVRLLIEGAHIAQSGGNIILGFKGRSSGDYKIRKVSIAERDVNSSVGNVVDSTWTRVTFDGKAYNSWELDEAVVLAGTEKQSDPISFSIQPGKDYYVTLKIVSPSVYLSPPSSYRELYFLDADHASDIDWSGNGHSLTQDYHALSSIYVISNTDLLPPRDVTNVGHSISGNQLTFTWTNPKSTENGTVIPENKDFAGVMIRYNTGKDVLPPASHSEGTLFYDKPGNLDTNDSCTNSIELGQHYEFSLFTYDSSGNYSHTVYITVDANPPGVINNFSASSGDKQITLSWTNPSDQDYAGTVIRYGTSAYPSGSKDGILVVDKKGTPSGNSSFIHGSLQNDLKYYYSAFAYDPSGNYSQAVNVSQAPRVPPDAIPPAPPAGTVVK